MWKFLYEFYIGSVLELPIEPFWSFFIMLIIGEVAHEIAYSFSPGGILGSPIYWITKGIVVIITWSICSAMIYTYYFIKDYWIILIPLAIIFILIVGLSIYKRNKIN